MKYLLLATSSISGLLASAAHAQSATEVEQEPTLEEIVVTAQKREQPLQDVPVAVTALGADALREHGVTDIFGLTGLAPNLEVTKTIETPSIFIRGVGTQSLPSGSDTSVATHIDGVYVARARAQVAGLYDIDRMEILRGPQGDLYGRNSTGGTLNILTRRPTEKYEAWVRSSTGNYSRADVEGAMSGPLVDDKLLGRLSFVSLNHSGYTRNVATGREVDDQHEKGVRGQLLWNATSNTSLLFSADYYTAHDYSGGWHVLGPGKFVNGVPVSALPASLPGYGAAIFASDPIRQISSERNPRRALELTNLAATATVEMSDAMRLKSITGYRKSRSDAATDIDGSQLPTGPLTRKEHGEQYSEELQLLYDTQATHTIVGVYYLKEWLFGSSFTPITLPGIPPGTVFFPVSHLTAQAAAAFGRIEYSITDQLGIAFGGRYSWEERSINAFIVQPFPPNVTNVAQESWQDFSPRLTLNYNVNPDVLSYVTVSKGFKSGTYVNAVNAVIDPEKVIAYEAGLKSELLNRKLQLNLAGFHYDFTDLQVTRIVGTNPIIDNASEATINGLEAEFQA